MTKLELIDIISEKCGITKKETSLIINEFLEQIKNSLEEGDKVVISNFGTFSKSKVSSYNVFNPTNGELLNISDMIRINFMSSKTWRDKIKR